MQKNKGNEPNSSYSDLKISDKTKTMNSGLDMIIDMISRFHVMESNNKITFVASCFLNFTMFLLH